jgi:hypothetical protein
MKSLLIAFLSIGALAGAPPSAHAHPEWLARFGQPTGDYEREFQELSKKGWSLRDVALYMDGGHTKVASIFAKTHYAFKARHHLTPEQYQHVFDEELKAGFEPVHVSAYNENGQPRLSVLFEKLRVKPEIVARHGLDSPAYFREFQKLEKEGYRLQDVAGYEENGQPRFAAIWLRTKDTRHLEFWARHDLTADQYQVNFNEHSGKGWRLERVNCYSVGGKQMYAALWNKYPEKVEKEHPWEGHHAQTGDEFQKTFDELVKKGYELVHLSACGTSDGPRFASIFMK